jgi:hypothetical protein
LNFDPNRSSELADLGFTYQSSTGGFTDQSTVLTGSNSFKADGDGSYDILFTYTTTNKPFQGSVSQTYLITDSAGTIHSSDFDFLSQPPTGGNGPFYAAIHVQNTPSGSAWVSGTPGGTGDLPGIAPEPSTMALAALGGLGFLGYGLRRRLRR